ncbi:exodeoxyribonuclease VII large subunit, partial [Reinekea sp.]|uniref:exodeoxyribonuclease VII large subunit n=1 Tax=Reinekea sp. TaxID=1970455 RepID=UPI00257F802E
TLSGLQVRLNRAIARPLLQHQQQLHGLQRRLGQVSPQLTIERDRRMLMQSEQRLQRALDGTLERKKGRFQQLIGKLNLLSPLATLERGYSITRDSQGTVIQQSHQVQVGGEIETLLKDGKIISIVERIL